MKKIRILVADDELFIRDILRSVLSEHYEVSEAADGDEALQKIKNETPDLVILDHKMPKMSGLDVCRAIREDSLRQHLSIIMLTGKGEIRDKVTGLDSGVDDYIVKPFEPEELLARVRMVLKRASRDLDANPLTRLPGNVSIMNEIQERIKDKDKFAVLYLDLDKFKSYNDYYGFERGDHLIKDTSRIIIESIQKKGRETDYVGHVGGDDFVVVTEPQRTKEIAQEIIDRFDEQIPLFYDEKDRKKGYIISKDRTGKDKSFPLVSISIGIVTNEHKDFSHVGEVSTIGAELKKYAKTFQKSIYVEEKRKE